MKRAHIDLGTGATQLNADVLPLGTAISQALANLSTLSIANTDSVRSGLAAIASSLSALASRVDADEDSIAAIAASLSATINDINTNVKQARFLPIGTIMMFDGENWQDNVTLTGWYACVASNAARGCPNLVDRFIKGGTGATRGSTYALLSSTNSRVISSSNLPAHVHNMDHKHTLSIVASADHQHSSPYYPYRSPDQYIDTGASGGIATLGQVENSKLGGSAGAHSHSGEAISPPRDASNNTKTNTLDGGFPNQALDIQPANYTVIFIRRCS